MNFISTVTDKMAEKATDFVCDKFKDVLTNKELKDKFKGASQKYFDQIFENCGLSGEFDFEAVETYLLNNFDNKIIAIFHEIKNIGSKGRDSIREDVLRGAVARGNGNEKAIRKYCNAIIDFVGTCLYDKISDSDKQLASEITVVTNEYYKHLINEMGDLKDIELKILSEIRYFGSFAEQIDNLGLPKVITKNKFSFANPNIGFYGRYDEQKEIDKFMSDNRLLLFWSITGRGGVGKSKFALHLCQKYEQKNWKAVWLNKDKIENINRTFRNDGYNKQLLFICDYASEYIESIKIFLLNVSCRAQNKIRVLLLDRLGYNQSSYEDFAYSDIWYNRLLFGHDCDEIKEIEYCTDSLNLDNYVLSDEDMFSILDDFSNGKLSANNKTDIVDFVKTSLSSVSAKDESLCYEERCLFLLFTADAFLHGNDYREWDTAALIDHYMNRFKRSLESHFDKNICKNAFILLGIATVIGTINLENADYDAFGGSYVTSIKNWLNYGVDINNLKRLLSVLCEKDTPDLNVYPMLPDLVGEFFFVDIFSRISSENKHEIYKIFCSEKYKSCFCRFLRRCLDDWHSLEKFQNIIKELFEFVIENCNTKFIDECANSFFFMMLSYYYKLEEKDLLWLKEMLLVNANENAYIEYAVILCLTTFDMSNVDKILTIAKKIKEEVLDKCNITAVAESYAMSLINAAYKTSNSNEILSILNLINNEVLSKFDVAEMAEQYVNALAYASDKISNADEILVIANRIKDEVLSNFNTIELDDQYVNVLINAICKMYNADEILTIANRIKDEVLSKHNTNEMVEQYVSAIVGASDKISNVNEILDIANWIKDEILSEYNTVWIAEEYAGILFDVTSKMTNADEILIIANRIKNEVLSQYNTVVIAEEYAAILFDVTYNMSNANEILGIANWIKDEILSDYNTDKVAEEYARMLCDVTFKMPNANDKLTIINQINDKILKVYNTKYIAKLYVISLCNLIEVTKVSEDCLNTASKIKEVLEKYGTKEIADIYTSILEYIFEMYPEHEYLLEEIENIRSVYNLAIDEE